MTDGRTLSEAVRNAVRFFRDPNPAWTEAEARQLNQRTIPPRVTKNQVAAPISANINQNTSIFLIVRSDLSIDPRCINGSVCGPWSTYPQGHRVAVDRFEVWHDGQFIAGKHSTGYLQLRAGELRYAAEDPRGDRELS